MRNRERFVALDLGSSFIKGAVLDLGALAIRHVERVPFPDPIHGLAPGFREFDPRQIVSATRALLERLLQHAPDAAGIVMCGQLHGTVLADERGNAVSNAINWQDQRALQPYPGGGGSYLDEIERRLGAEDRRRLGNEARPGVPLCHLFWLAQNEQLPRERAIVAAIPDFVVARLCGSTPRTDVTYAYGHGALDVETLAWHRDAIEKLGLAQVDWPEIVAQGTVVGEVPVGARRLPIFAPVGDYQCSQAGAFLDEGELSVNISTGSAVIRLAHGLEFGDFQTRPYFDGRFLRTITHIPGGRALNALVRLLNELAAAQGYRLRDPWEYILAEAERAGATDLNVDPAFYFSAMGEQRQHHQRARGQPDRRAPLSRGLHRHGGQLRALCATHRASAGLDPAGVLGGRGAANRAAATARLRPAGAGSSPRGLGGGHAARAVGPRTPLHRRAADGRRRRRLRPGTLSSGALSHVVRPSNRATRRKTAAGRPRAVYMSFTPGSDRRCDSSARSTSQQKSHRIRRARSAC